MQRECQQASNVASPHAHLPKASQSCESSHINPAYSGACFQSCVVSDCILDDVYAIVHNVGILLINLSLLLIVPVAYVLQSHHKSEDHDPTTTMLLTKPLTSFLQQNLSPQVHTLFITTPSGKILASSSSLAAGILRSQAALASTLWSAYKPITSSGTLSATLPQEDPPSQDGEVISLLIQLEYGTMLIRLLRCNLLFIAIGPSATPNPQTPRDNGSALPSSQNLHLEHHTASLQRDLSHLTMASLAGDTPISDLVEYGEQQSRAQSPALNKKKEYAGSEAGSTSTAGGSGASLRRIKRRVEELATWLDDELGDFQLGDPL